MENNFLNHDIQNTAFQLDDLTFHSFIDSLISGVIVTDELFTIQYANPAMCDLYNLTDNQVTGMELAHLFEYKFPQPTYLDLTAKLNLKEDFIIEEYDLDKNLWLRYEFQFTSEALMIFVNDITDIIHNQNRIHCFAALAENLSDAIVTTDEKFCITGWNTASTSLYGWDVKEVIGQPVLSVLKTKFSPNFALENIINTITYQGIWQGQLNQFKKDGNLVQVNLSLTTLLSNNGAPIGYIALIKDNSERIKIEHLLMQAEQHFRSITDAIPQLVWSVDPNGNVDYCNKQWINYTGVSREEITHINHLKNFIHPQDISAYEKIHESAYNLGKEYQVEYRMKKHDGTYQWFLECAAPLIDENNQIVKWFGACTEIEDQKRAEIVIDELLDENEIQKLTLTTLMTVSTDVIIIYDRQGRHLAISDTGVNTYNKKINEIIGKTTKEIDLPYDVNNKVTKAILKVIGTKDSQQIEYCLTNHGQTKYYEAVLNPVIKNCEVDLIICICRDITHRKHEEERLRQNEEKFRSLVESLNDFVYLLDTEGKYQEIYGDWAKKNPIKTKRFLNKKISDVLPSSESRIHEKALKKALTGQRVVFEWCHNSENKLERFHNSLSPLFSNDGKVSGIVGVGRDITGLWELENRKDEFISIASHELKTPVTSIKIYIRLLQKITSGLSIDFDEYLKKMDSQVNKLTDLISELLDISKIHAGRITYQNEIFDLLQLTREIVDDAEKNYKTHKINLEGGLEKQICGDRNRIGQVINNLISNAVKYSPSNKNIAIKLYSDSNNAYLEIIDRGIGIANIHHEKIFERFYRIVNKAHKTFSGMGIGLYISNEIIKRHGGKFELKSEPGQGSKFTFSIPFQDQSKE